MRPRLSLLLKLLPYFYLLRVPIFTAAVLLLLPPVALSTNVKPLLGNLFDVNAGGLAGIVVAALTAAWTTMITGWLIVLYGARRFKAPRLRIPFPPRPIHVFLYSLLAAPIVIGLVAWTTSQSGASVLSLAVEALIGVAIAVYLLYRTLLLVNTLSGLADWITPLARLGAGYTVSPQHASQELALEWRSVPLNKFGRPIYRDPARPPGWKSGRVLLPGHALALASALGFFFLYIAIGIGKWVRIGNPPTLPTLGYILLLITILCFGLTGLTFFFDRYRVPVLLPVLFLFLFTSQFSCSDHFFPVVVRTATETGTLSPADALRAGGRPAAIVVAANGGGIQAASWTAQVLTGLEEKCRQEVAQGCTDFAGAVRLISSVSGGSVGSMYFVNAFEDRTHALPRDLAPIRQRAEASSLDDIAWGLVYPDLWRVVVPWFWKNLDRGVALESALTRETGLARPLSVWREGVRQGWRPATVFNATIAETGERLLLSTTDLPAHEAGGSDLYSENFAAGKDVKVVTAARLSASFPYVSPAARADLPGARFHIVDGGYYDNYGISTLVEWLDEALAAPGNPVRRVLVIEIRGAPNDPFAQPKLRGWFYQAFAPVSAMLHVRTAGQFAHNRVESDLLTRLWTASQPGPVQIEHAVFQFCDPNPPLSWHLTAKQKGAIADAWKTEITKNKNWLRVVRFLAGDSKLPAANSDPCVAEN